MKPIAKWLPLIAALTGRNNRFGCFAEDDLHANWQGGGDVLLRKTEERKVVLQAGEEGSRQVLL